MNGAVEPNALISRTKCVARELRVEFRKCFLSLSLILLLLLALDEFAEDSVKSRKSSKGAVHRTPTHSRLENINVGAPGEAGAENKKFQVNTFSFHCAHCSRVYRNRWWKKPPGWWAIRHQRYRSRYQSKIRIFETGTSGRALVRQQQMMNAAQGWRKADGMV